MTWLLFIILMVLAFWAGTKFVGTDGPTSPHQKDMDWRKEKLKEGINPDTLAKRRTTKK